MFEVRKLVAQRGDVALGEAGRHVLHEGVTHAGTRAVSEHVEGKRASGPIEKRRYVAGPLADANAEFVRHRSPDGSRGEESSWAKTSQRRAGSSSVPPRLSTQARTRSCPRL